MSAIVPEENQEVYFPKRFTEVGHVRESITLLPVLSHILTKCCSAPQLEAGARTIQEGH